MRKKNKNRRQRSVTQQEFIGRMGIDHPRKHFTSRCECQERTVEFPAGGRDDRGPGSREVDETR